jgi:acyl-CoA synthetase (AMP-forming)/AMP-acid ligase II
MRRNLIAFLISFTATLIVGYVVLSINIDQSVLGAIDIELIARFTSRSEVNIIIGSVY